jgi:hypothetical protein
MKSAVAARKFRCDVRAARRQEVFVPKNRSGPDSWIRLARLRLATVVIACTAVFVATTTTS